MNMILRFLLTAIAVVILSKVLPGVSVDGYLSAVIVAVVLGLLNFFIKPLLVIFTLPVTILTLGLFLIVINGIIILLAGKLIDGFRVDGILYAIVFSFLLSVLQSLLHSLLKDDKKK